MLKVVALDIGGVCLNVHSEEIEKIFESSIPDEFTAVSHMLEKGIITKLEWLNIFQYLTKNRFSNHELQTAWAKVIGESIEGMPELAQELSDAGYKLVFFSDTSESHIQEVYRNLSFANLVTGAILSHEVGAKKPDKTMYEAFENKYGKPIFYTDDQDANVKAGQNIGWESHLFTSPENMRKALVNADIL